MGIDTFRSKNCRSKGHRRMPEAALTAIVLRIYENPRRDLRQGTGTTSVHQIEVQNKWLGAVGGNRGPQATRLRVRESLRYDVFGGTVHR